MRNLLILFFVLNATYCASTDVKDSESDNARRANEISERETLQRRLREEEQKRKITMQKAADDREAYEKKQEEARLKQEAREEKLRRAEQAKERERAETAATHKEEERKRQERMQLQREQRERDKEREDAQKGKEEEAARAKLEADRLEAERRRKEEREKRLAKADPDRRAFFRIESRKFGESIVCRIPTSKNGMVYRNKKPLQFQGFAAGTELIRPDVDQGMVLQTGELSSNLIGRKGNFIALILPDEKSRTLLQDFDLLRCDGVPGSAFVIGIESDGEGSVLLELEQAEKSIAGRYFKVAPDSIRIVKD